MYCNIYIYIYIKILIDYLFNLRIKQTDWLMSLLRLIVWLVWCTNLSTFPLSLWDMSVYHRPFSRSTFVHAFCILKIQGKPIQSLLNNSEKHYNSNRLTWIRRFMLISWAKCNNTFPMVTQLLQNLFVFITHVQYGPDMLPPIHQLILCKLRVCLIWMIWSESEKSPMFSQIGSSIKLYRLDINSSFSNVSFSICRQLCTTNMFWLNK